MSLTADAARAQDAVLTVINAFHPFEPHPDTSEADRIAWALLQAALEDAQAIAGLLGHPTRVLVSAATTLQRPLTEKLKRATWATLVDEEQVLAAYRDDRFPAGKSLVSAIEAKDPDHTMFSRLFSATPDSFHGFVHGGTVLVDLYRDGGLEKRGVPSKPMSALLEHVTALAIDAGFLGASLVAKHEPMRAAQLQEQFASMVA